MKKAELKWQAYLRQHGCVVCVNLGYGPSEASIHHILHAGKKIDEMHTLPLCPQHHQYGNKSSGAIPRHANGSWGGLKAFTAAYGTEHKLLDQLRGSI